QAQILEDYVRDFAKHIPARILQRTLEAWESIPAHLAQENKKFVFGHVRNGARAKEYDVSEKHANTRPLRFSLSGYRDAGWMRNIPLYAIGQLSKWSDRLQ
ncbi:MAG: hypothetical protein LBD25_02330, partial [Coriobacteriales bacterium]|nr:hypothetical protein [Coriobacteriales bacterium]